MRLQWVGQACFYVTAQDGRSILFDPYQRSIGIPRGNFDADVVVFSHAHLDHCDPSAIGPTTEIVAGPGTRDAAGFRFTNVLAYHDRKEGLLSGEVTLCSVTVDGFRIVHLSDLGHLPTESMLRRLGRPDVLLFPAGEYTTLTLAEAQEVIGMMAPRIAVPMAYHLPGLIMPAASLDKVLRAFPTHRRTAWLELVPGQRLVPRTEIRILDPLAYPPVGSNIEGQATG